MRSEWDEFEVSTGEVLHEGDDLVVVEERVRGKIRRRAAFTSREDALEAAGLT